MRDFPDIKTKEKEEIQHILSIAQQVSWSMQNKETHKRILAKTTTTGHPSSSQKQIPPA